MLSVKSFCMKKFDANVKEENRLRNKYRHKPVSRSVDYAG